METVAFVEEMKEFSLRAPFSNAQISLVTQGGKKSVEEWVSRVASERGLAVRKTPMDTFARAVSLLSDGVVDLDPVEDTLVALSRAGVITAYQRGLLQIRYLR